MAEVLFFLAGIGAIAGAIGVVALRNPFYSVLALVSHLLSLAALFLLLRAEFVAAAQVVVYAGAVMVLYVFVVAYVGGQDEPLGARPGRGLRLTAALCGAALFVELCIATLGSGLQAIDTDGAALEPGFGSPAQIGELLLTRLPAAVRDRVVPAAHRGCRRGRARAPARRDQRRRGPGALQRDGHAAPRVHRHDGRGRRRPAAGRRRLARPAGERRADARERRARARRATPAGGRRLMAIGWYLAVSALIFTIGAAGVLTRRSPLVILLCLELMLNAANLALIAFARMHGNADGQIFAIIVMVVAACEVTVGLGLIVAMHRRRLPIDVDEMRELQG